VEVFEAYKSLMESCWAQDPEDRPTFLEVHMELCELFGSTCD
jgi:hypothetical protein